MKVITGFFMAWGCFTAIPCPYKRWDEAARKYMLVTLPLIGLIIGALWYAVFILLGTLKIPFLLSVAVLTLMPQLLSGFIHVDGFMDCCDAVFSRRTLAEKQRILKDSHVGAFGVIGLLVWAMISFGALGDLTFRISQIVDMNAGDVSDMAGCLLMIPVVSRFMSAVSVGKYRAMEHSQYSGTYMGIKLRLVTLLILYLSGLAVYLTAELPYSVIIAEVAAYWLACLYARRQLGGMSGDVAGFCLVISETAALVCACLVI